MKDEILEARRQLKLLRASLSGSLKMARANKQHEFLIADFEIADQYAESALAALDYSVPVPMILHCPKCHYKHIDAPKPDIGWTNPPHRTHLCHACGHLWRPANVPTVGVSVLLTWGEENNEQG